MRYYSIIITDAKSGQVYTPPGFNPSLLGGASYTSYVNGQTLGAAWNIELDVPVISQATPQGGALMRIWGISLQEIMQANNLKGKNVAVYGGMQKGLPLAKPQQSGLLFKGMIFQAFGNWVETDMTLDFVLMPMTATASDPGNVGTFAVPRNHTLNWKAGTPLAGALTTCLQAAYPGRTVNVNISSSIVRNNDEIGIYPTLEQLNQYVLATSKNIVKTPNYPGIHIVVFNDQVLAFDGTSGASSGSPSTGGSSSSSSTAIAFEDLIGQPTWIESPDIQFKTVMRADLKINQKITLPQTLVINTAQASSALLNQQLTFQGGFTINSVRHVGNYRQPSGDSWVTIFEAFPNQIVGASS